MRWSGSLTGSVLVGAALVGTALVGSVPVGSVPVGSVPVGSVPVGSVRSVGAAVLAPGSPGAAVRAADAQDEAPWVWPTGSRIVERGWEAPADDYAAGHRGIDVAASIGTPAVAVASGTVSFAGSVAGRGVVSIDHGGGLVSTLDSVDPSVSTGDEVDQGSTVGTVSVGHCPASAPCLHLGARVDGRYVDPLPYLPAAEWPVLLPDDAWPG
ncbi:M23 family metallopeptidase [Curtobacterium citreum]|uniref:M23 family metallopeptidase n=1 Tax=Curtobacterium citreum TaxID=2036 RepID=A0ABT2HED0_9MICO|nr:M23 family metallopeptidase [Curtobacterium citreum]MCS6521570.1 M23 family metallopeptidase [Curtobacterium citreum]TQJ28428.1 peptidase M23-like protein [Curtobacterium citreum]